MIEQTIIYCYPQFRNQITNLNNFQTYIDGNVKTVTDKKVFDKCVDYIFTNDQSLKPPDTLYDMKRLKNAMDLRIESRHIYFNIRLSTKHSHTLYKLKIIGLRSNENPLCYIGTSEENFGHVIDTIKKSKMDCNGTYTYDGKELTRNDSLISCNFQNGENEIIFQKKNVINANNVNVNMNVNVDNNVVAHELVPKKVNHGKAKKQTISKAKKISVWETHVGKNIGCCKCFCCKTHEITQMNFACGHILSEHEGGTLDVNNLRPVCTTCNSSMGTKNMREFMRDEKMGELE